MLDEFSKETLEQLIISAKDFCLLNGLIMLDKTNIENDSDVSKSFRAIHSPVALFPSVYPLDEFNTASLIQNSFNQLIYQISNDYEFLKESFKNIIKIDEFSRNLFEIYEAVRNEGVTQPISLHIMRNDYILDLNKTGKPTMLSQIEYNTISCASGAATTQVTKLHSYILRIAEREDSINKQAPNNNLNGLAKGIVEAWKLYENPNACVVFLVRKNETNIGDQRLLEFKCVELDSRLKIIRLSFDDLSENIRLDSEKKLFKGDQEIALVYYRAGYDPVDYPTAQEWNIRKTIELSNAIKCPTVNYHLAGAKIVQQKLFESQIVEKYIKDEEIASMIRSVFVDQYSFGKENDKETIQMMIKNCDQFVLKPQREGGGNKIFGHDIKKYIETHHEEDLQSYVLMRLVKGVQNENYLMRPGESLVKKELISEMGVFGVLIGDSNSGRIVHNETTGYLLRSKFATANEGGVGIGTAVLDSILFI